MATQLWTAYYLTDMSILIVWFCAINVQKKMHIPLILKGQDLTFPLILPTTNHTAPSLIKSKVQLRRKATKMWLLCHTASILSETGGAAAELELVQVEPGEPVASCHETSLSPA